MEHLLHVSDNYSARIWALAGSSLTLASGFISIHRRRYPGHKPHMSLLHLLDSTTQKVAILFLQEVKQDIVLWHAQLKNPRIQDDLQTHIQAHLLLVRKKITVFMEYQGVVPFQDALSFLQRTTYSVLHD